MVEESISFLTSIVLPPHCFVSEAVEWAALGRVPQAEWSDDGHSDEQIDYRFNSHVMPDNFEPSFVTPWFERPEFESLGIPINEEYFSAAEKCYLEYVHGLPAKISEYEAKDPVIVENDDGTSFNIWKAQAENCWQN